MWSLVLACTPPGSDADSEPTSTTEPPPIVTETGTVPTSETVDSGTITTDDGKISVGSLVFDEGPPRNILAISLDPTRRDWIGRFNGGTDTPNLDAWLDGAYVLDNHRSCSNWTAWSMTCVISGRNPMENGFATWSYGDGRQVPNFPP